MVKTLELKVHARSKWENTWHTLWLHMSGEYSSYEWSDLIMNMEGNDEPLSAMGKPVFQQHKRWTLKVSEVCIHAHLIKIDKSTAKFYGGSNKSGNKKSPLLKYWSAIHYVKVRTYWSLYSCCLCNQLVTMRSTVPHEDKILCQNYDTLMVIYWRNILYFLFALLIICAIHHWFESEFSLSSTF